MKNYLIIGGSSGIGQELSRHLAAKGNRVFATYNTHEHSDNGKISYHYLNVLSDEMDLSFLPEELHGLAYCPGAIQLAPFGRIKKESFISDYQLQVIGAVEIIKACIPLLKKAGNSSVLLFSTVAVQKGFNFHSLVSASKGAIEGLTRSLAAEFAPTIRFNAIAPSLTDTPLAAKLLSSEEKKQSNADRHPLKSIGSTKDIAQAAEYLLTDDSAWVTGQILHVDGGISTINT